MSVSHPINSPLRGIARPSPTVAVSVLALLITFSGVAGALPGKNTIDSGDVKKNALKGTDIRESTLKLPPVAVAGGLKVSVHSQAVGLIGAFQSRGATATCPAGKQAIAGGGLSHVGGATNFTGLTDSRPSQGPSGSAPGALVKDGESFVGWRGYWAATGSGANPVVYVVCVG
jgi:hypothetical protein